MIRFKNDKIEGKIPKECLHTNQEFRFNCKVKLRLSIAINIIKQLFYSIVMDYTTIKT